MWNGIAHWTVHQNLVPLSYFEHNIEILGIHTQKIC
jgi:hypothetical protein